MTLENQVCSLEVAKRLKELGVKQESLVSWQRLRAYETSAGAPEHWEIRHYADFSKLSKNDTDEERAAFTVAELGEMLPMSMLAGEVHNQIFTDRFGGKWLVGYANLRDDDVNFANTEADARAEALIFLLENKFLTA